MQIIYSVKRMIINESIRVAVDVDKSIKVTLRLQYADPLLSQAIKNGLDYFRPIT